MKDLKKTYKVSLKRAFLISLSDIILFFLIIIASCVLFFNAAITVENLGLGGKLTFIFIGLFFTLYVGLYPLLIYWSYYQHDKDIMLTIDREHNEVVYQNKTTIKQILMEDIVRLEQYYSLSKNLKMQYYKLILKDGSQIVLTCLLNTMLWKKFDNIPFERIVENYLWLLKKEKT